MRELRPLKRVLIANRGEIAMRIIRACADEEIESVLAVSEADRDSAAAIMADSAVCIGPPPANDSYLDIDRVVSAAKVTGCDALHPGYGFLSERPELAEACEDADIQLVGPTAAIIRDGGDKTRARALAAVHGVAIGSGTPAMSDVDEAVQRARAVGYPLLLKAAAGGGGRGMVKIADPAQLADAFQTASREAEVAFGDGRIYLEHFVERARHVEVQILGDVHGGLFHLGTRDCSVQRRYQKVVEEGPATAISDEVRADIEGAALRLGRGLEYVGAGTVEFVVDTDTGAYSFLEINTRVQVEHPVTELLTGVDIVREQLRIAGGAPLGFTQAASAPKGHVIECRINCEDPQRGFAPTPGTITRWMAPAGADIRVDTHVFPGYSIPPYYDSLLAKLLVRGRDRDEARRRMARLLEKLVVEGVPTNRELLHAVVTSDEFGRDTHHTRWLEEDMLPSWSREKASP
jgi:acetyl-CoA carboxylase biotin carboxylase subunit